MLRLELSATPQCRSLVNAPAGHSEGSWGFGASVGERPRPPAQSPQRPISRTSSWGLSYNGAIGSPSPRVPLHCPQVDPARRVTWAVVNLPLWRYAVGVVRVHKAVSWRRCRQGIGTERGVRELAKVGPATPSQPGAQGKNAMTSTPVRTQDSQCCQEQCCIQPSHSETQATSRRGQCRGPVPLVPRVRLWGPALEILSPI